MSTELNNKTTEAENTEKECEKCKDLNENLKICTTENSVSSNIHILVYV